ncbi:hypothetical protein [Amycolatopsis sp. H20-H5]|uniref:hypothetical protein n=1 Tax=Amycolatopsis sp. H20-H5 TaxID=3046309 RepID=UPI002DBA4873|nr:hypothetical protein [Amycolatopsis sp. H20-H5]MEC3979552.1 hypothetical protein [Amycolatopsis sp. H20-H5]
MPSPYSRPGGVSAAELIELAAGPVLGALPGRAAVDDQYNPEATDEEIRLHGPVSDDPAELVAEVERHVAWAAALDQTPFAEQGELTRPGLAMFSLVLRGSVRGVLSGVYDTEPSEREMRLYGDGESVLLWNILPDRTQFEYTDFGDLPELVAGSLPPVPEGVGDPVRVALDEHGMVAEGQEDEVGLITDLLARERAGTTLVDLVAFGGLCAEYPDNGFVLVDNDLGRHALCVAERELRLVPLGRRALCDWLRKSVEAGRVGPP